MQGIDVIGQGSTIVFLHSSLSSSKQWQGLAVNLSEKFQCINIDLLGYGKAPAVADETAYSFASEVERIEHCLMQYGVTEPYHLVGHSCGGAIALKMAVQAPEKIASLTLYEPVAFHLLEQRDEHGVKAFADQLGQQSLATAAASFINYWNGEGFFQSLPQALQAQMTAGMSKVNLDFHGIFSERYQLSDLSVIKCPVLLLKGRATTKHSKQLSELIASALGNPVLCSVDAGHMGPISHSHLVNPVITKFLLKLR